MFVLEHILESGVGTFLNSTLSDLKCSEFSLKKLFFVHMAQFCTGCGMFFFYANLFAWIYATCLPLVHVLLPDSMGTFSVIDAQIVNQLNGFSVYVYFTQLFRICFHFDNFLDHL